MTKQPFIWCVNNGESHVRLGKTLDNVGVDIHLSGLAHPKRISSAIRPVCPRLGREAIAAQRLEAFADVIGQGQCVDRVVLAE